MIKQSPSNERTAGAGLGCGEGCLLAGGAFTPFGFFLIAESGYSISTPWAVSQGSADSLAALLVNIFKSSAFNLLICDRVNAGNNLMGSLFTLAHNISNRVGNSWSDPQRKET